MSELKIDSKHTKSVPANSLMIGGLIWTIASALIVFMLFAASKGTYVDYSSLNCTDSGLKAHGATHDSTEHLNYIELCKLKNNHTQPMQIPIGIFAFIPAIGIVMMAMGFRKYAWDKKMMKLDNQTEKEREKEKQKEVKDDNKEINYWDMS